MRKYQMTPALAAAIHAVRTAPFREVQVPLYLELPPTDSLRAPSFVEFDAEEGHVEAGGFTIGADEDDDDFY